MFRPTLLLTILFGLVSTNCVGNSSMPVGEDGIDFIAVSGADYRYKGKVAYESSDGKLISSTGCEVNYTYFKPKGRSKDVFVIVGHGFMRNRDRMAQLAQHLASWGLAVVNVEFCNSKLWAGNHDLNGADMVAVSKKLNANKVIYTGFSAGGLAGMVASNLDKNTVALFGLDMVDNQGLGKKIAADLDVPFYGLIAAPSACNADNNGLESYAVAKRTNVIEVEDASHCHFEFPVDGKCTFLCGMGERRFKRKIIQQTIFAMTTAFLLWQSGIDPDGKTWWPDRGLNYKSMMDAGYIKKVIDDDTGPN